MGTAGGNGLYTHPSLLLLNELRSLTSIIHRRERRLNESRFRVVFSNGSKRYSVRDEFSRNRPSPENESHSMVHYSLQHGTRATRNARDQGKVAAFGSTTLHAEAEFTVQRREKSSGNLRWVIARHVKRRFRGRKRTTTRGKGGKNGERAWIHLRHDCISSLLSSQSPR